MTEEPPVALSSENTEMAPTLVPSDVTAEPSPELSPENAALAPAYNTIQQQQWSNLSLQTQNVNPPAVTPAVENPEDVDVPDATDTRDTVDLTYLSDASLQLSTQLETRIRILDDRGVVLVDSLQQDKGQDLRTDPSVAGAMEGQYTSRTDRDEGTSTMHLAFPAIVEGQLVGVVYLSQPLSDVTQVLHDLRTRWLLSTTIALLLSAVLGLLLSRAIANPLRRLTAAAGAVAQGRFDQQVPVDSRDELGRLSRAFNDMTARLRAAHQMQVDFVADVSHELRTPLTAVKGTIETLRDGAVDDAEVRDRFLETIENETDRLIRLVNDLLILSRADSEALNLRRESVSLAQLVAGVVDRLASRAEAHGVVLQVQADAGSPLAWADPDRVEQVLVNLLDNAVKYSHPGGTVTISVSAAQDQTALVQVRDEGIGIRADDLPRVGGRFFRADKARSRTEGGSGLGLAIAEALVHAHGGHLWLESQEGVGTTVSFTLPTP
jgi:signal transduction histidine kinase